MGNCLNICYDSQEQIRLLKDERSRERDYLLSIHHEEKTTLNDKIKNQDEEINNLKKRVIELERRSDQLLLDYYNLEKDYYKCKNELQNCKGHLGSFRNIFSL